MYRPTVDAQHLLVNTIIPGVLKGISEIIYRDGIVQYAETLINPAHKAKYNRVEYDNVEISKGVYNTIDVWNVTCDVKVYDVEENVELIESGERIWLSSIPRLDEDGLLRLGNLKYYMAMRQRLVSNIPIVVVHKSGATLKTTCIIRSENYHTLESTFITISREKSNSYSVMLKCDVTGINPVNIAGYLRAFLKVQDWQQLVKDLFISMGATDTVITLLHMLMSTAEEVIPYRYIMPGTLDTKSEHYGVTVGEHMYTTEFLMICRMLYKFLKVECGEDVADDRDNCANKVVDSYANLLGKLFRTLVMGLGTFVISKSKVGSPCLHQDYVEAFTKNCWNVMRDYKSDMQISRLVEYSNVEGITASLQEVIILASNLSSSNDFGERFDVRMIHPTHKGFLCQLRTSDDNNAGLKLYLGSDCRISKHQLLYGIDRDDDNYKLRLLASQKRDNRTIFWIHNNNLVALANKEHVIETLYSLKSKHPELSWEVSQCFVDSRYCYGRFLCIVNTDSTLTQHSRHRLNTSTNTHIASTSLSSCLCRITGVEVTMLDSREIDNYPGSRERVSKFSSLCYDVVYMNRMPPARAMLSAKIIHKCLTSPQTLQDALQPRDSYLYHLQKPLVRTTKSRSFCYGYNAVVCYGTFQGYGIEDGLIINKASADRGLFSVIKRTNIIWNPKIGTKILNYTINTKINEHIKEGSVLVVIVYEDENKVVSNLHIKHSKPYECKVENIELSFDTSSGKIFGSVEPRYLIECSITLVRVKKPEVGDKLSSRMSQKSVICRLVSEEDMPMIMHMYNKNLSSNVMSPPPTVDVIVNPLSIVSRCTVSQSISSTLGMRAVEVGGIAVETPFQHTVIDYTTRHRHRHKQTHKHQSEIDVNSMGDYLAVVADGATGKMCATKLSIGIEYYMVLNHIADEKVRTNSSSKKGKGGSYVKYNWQELFALLHSKSYNVADNLYKESDEAENYPYCVVCDRDVESYNNCCSLCGTNITSTISYSKSFAVAKKMVSVLSCDMIIKSKQGDI